MLTSPAYGTLAKILEALRAHDTDTIEALADPRVRSGSYEPEEKAREAGEGGQEQLGGERGPSASARELLKFSVPRDPALLARFVRLRVIEPENSFWRRGIEACVRYVKETGAVQLRVPYGFVTPDGWVPAGFPLGTWLADQRRFNKAGRLAQDRVAELDGLGMVWSHQDVAFEEGLAAARAWAAVLGHFLPPGSQTSSPNAARPASPSHPASKPSPRHGERRWTRSTRAGARYGTPGGSAASGSPRPTSKAVGQYRRSWVR
ncbi:helicase associated domain-containing protein [Streptomyces nondiastaticus]|uniref:Helicase associated domain-containing protein n=1 Tax=Streptomyces nondiastaticus TaxID=3154512 RepID=A0ABW6U8K5_9ACTN